MPTHRRQGTKATPRAPLRGGGWGGGTLLPKDTAINKVLFFECFYYFFCWDFIFFLSPRPPGNKTFAFWNCTKFTQRGEGAFGLVEEGTARPCPPFPPATRGARRGRGLGTKQHPGWGGGGRRHKGATGAIPAAPAHPAGVRGQGGSRTYQ